MCQVSCFVVESFLEAKESLVGAVEVIPMAQLGAGLDLSRAGTLALCPQRC